MSANDLTTANLELINGTRRTTGHRFLIKKAAGHYLYRDNPEITTIRITGGDINTGSGNDSYIQVIRDTYANRNRTIILHNKDIQSNDSVVTVIDHLRNNEVVEINKVTSSGWPVSPQAGRADNMYLAEVENKLYVATQGTGSIGPCVLKIDLDNLGDALASCGQLDDNDAFLECTLYYDDSTLLHNNAGRYCIIGYQGGRVWLWYESASPTFARACGLGYFTATNAFRMMWGSGNGSKITTFPATNALGFYDTFMTDLTAWEMNETEKRATLAFAPSNAASGYEYGHEAAILEIDLAAVQDYSTLSTYWAHDFTMTFAATGIPTGGSPAYSFAGCNFVRTVVNLREYGITEGMVQIYAVGNETQINTNAYLFIRGSSTSIAGTGQFGAFGTHNFIMTVEPGQESITFMLGLGEGGTGDDQPSFSAPFHIYVRQFPPGLISYRTVFDPDPIVQEADTARPALELLGCTGEYQYYRAEDLGDTLYTKINHIAATDTHYLCSVVDQADVPLGLWLVKKDGTAIVRMTAANSDLAYDTINKIISINNQSFLIASGVNSSPSGGSVQLFDGERLEFTWGADVIDFAPTDSGATNNMDFDGSWLAVGNGQEIHLMYPPSVDVTRSNNLRDWWDGSYPDVIIGGGDTNVALDERGRLAGFKDFMMTHTKGEASYSLQFSVDDIMYMPWASKHWDGTSWRYSKFNENPTVPGTYDGTLEHGGRILLQRGVQAANGTWTWINEGQFYIIEEPCEARGGIASMTVTGQGPIGALLTRAVYEATHAPEEVRVTGATLTTTDDLSFYYEPGGESVYDWASTPEPVIYIDGAVTTAYTLNTASGTVTFNESQAGKTITGDFTYYVAGTNEAEDIIRCILIHPNEIGGAGLDENYFTRHLDNEYPASDDNTVFTLAHPNIRRYDGSFEVWVGAGKVFYYLNGIELNIGGVTIDWRAGTITFPTVQLQDVRVNYTYYTLEPSGVTLREIAFSPKDYNNAYDCINEVCRRVAPNYIFYEAPDGKLESAFFTMQPFESEHYIIEDSDILINAVSDNPMYHGLANYIISYGQAPLSERENLCLNKTVTDLWSIDCPVNTPVYPASPWRLDAGAPENAVDGDPGTMAYTAFGRWSTGTYAVQNAMVVAGDDGLRVIQIDMGEIYEVQTIIYARGNSAANEGDAGDVLRISLWVSSDGSTFKKLVNQFHCPPGQNVTLEAGTNFEAGEKFQHIQVRWHSLGLYKHSSGKTHSQADVSELQCYEGETIEGVAAIQDDDPDGENFDRWGIKKRYGYLTYVARNGQPDPALYTQEKVDQDARDILDEMIRLLSQCSIEGPYLPGIRLYKTLRVTSGALRRTVRFFVESKTITAAGDTFQGTRLP